jgi:hypothetical protein
MTDPGARLAKSVKQVELLIQVGGIASSFGLSCYVWQEIYNERNKLGLPTDDNTMIELEARCHNGERHDPIMIEAVKKVGLQRSSLYGQNLRLGFVNIKGNRYIIDRKPYREIVVEPDDLKWITIE